MDREIGATLSAPGGQRARSLIEALGWRPMALRQVLPADANWRLRAACLSMDPDLFFPISEVGEGIEQTARAKAVCAGCPVPAECLAFALATRQAHGIWGGQTERERLLSGTKPASPGDRRASSR